MNNTSTLKQSATPVLEPEWIRINEACRFASVTKPVLYEWMRRGLVKNFSNRQRGQIKGARLVNLESLRQFLESRASGGQAE
jgi:hypothetical protein